MPGRRFSSGENHRRAKLTDDKVVAMRRERTEGTSIKFLQDKYGVSEMTVRDVVLRRTWRHLPAD
jgi:Mor family transcriptional regulator